MSAPLKLFAALDSYIDGGHVATPGIHYKDGKLVRLADGSSRDGRGSELLDPTTHPGNE